MLIRFFIAWRGSEIQYYYDSNATGNNRKMACLSQRSALDGTIPSLFNNASSDLFHFSDSTLALSQISAQPNYSEGIKIWRWVHKVRDIRAINHPSRA